MKTNSHFLRGLPSSGNCKRPNRTGPGLRRGWISRWHRQRALERDERAELNQQADQKVEAKATEAKSYLRSFISNLRGGVRKMLKGWG